MKQNQLLCCDWGTTSFRLYLINTATSEIISMVKTDQGIARTFEAFQMEKAENRVSFFRKYLNTQIEVLASKSYQNLENTTIILSGMASSSIGMQEVPYQKTPFRLNQPQLCIEYFPGNSAFSNDVYLYGGLRTEEEVMRGEEVQLLGLSHLIEKDACVCILPGTHSKHIWLEEKVVTDFQTYMTGECFQLMSQQSILKQSVIPSLEFSTQNQRFFKEGIQKAMEGRLLNSLFSVRTNTLLKNISKADNYYYLSGLLIGFELKNLQAFNGQILLNGEIRLANLYHMALSILGLDENLLLITSNDLANCIPKAHLKLYQQQQLS